VKTVTDHSGREVRITDRKDRPLEAELAARS
jgi:hypothetical protein